MVRISTIYDTDIKKRVFLVRGDEGYARSTSLVLDVDLEEMSDMTPLGFKVPISVNVLRDRGTSTVVVYDNDTVINMIDWSENQSTALEFTSATLAWNAEHNIVAKYIGNSQCSPSSSSFIIPPQINEDKYETSLEFTTLTQLTYPNVEYTVEVTVTCEALNINGSNIDFYLDGEELGSAEVTNGVATLTYSTEKQGYLGLKAKYEGGLNHYASEVEENISSGITGIELIDLPTALDLNNAATVKGAMYPYGDIEGDLDVDYAICGYLNGTKDELATGTCSGQGTIITKSITFGKPYDYYQLELTNNEITYYSPKYTVLIYNLTDITLTGKNVVAEGFANHITGTLVGTGGIIENVPVEIWWNDEYYTSVRTDAGGKFSIDLWGDGYGDNTVTAKITTDYSSDYVSSEDFEYEDVIQYWDRTEINPVLKFNSYNARVLNLSNGFKIECIDNSKAGAISFDDTPTGDYMVEYDQITGSGYKTRIQVGSIIYTGNISWTGTHIKFVKQGSVGSLYIDDVLAQQGEATGLFLFGINMSMQTSSEKSWITINNFKLKRLSGD